MPPVAKPGGSVIIKPVVHRAHAPAVPKRESHTPFLGDQTFGDGQHTLSTSVYNVSRKFKSRNPHKQAESSDDEPSGTTHTFGYVLDLL